MSKPTLGYWNIRGLAQPIRLAYELAGVDYEDKLWEYGPAPDYRGEGCLWMKEKFNIGLEIPNLPYLIDGDLKLVESNAILLHVARTHNLYGQSEEHKCRVDMMLCMLSDARVPFAMLCYRSDAATWEANKANFLNNQLPGVLSKFSTFLGNRPYVAGDVVTVADVALFEFLDVLSIFNKEHGQENFFDAYPKLKELHAKVAALEPVAKYLTSDRCIKRPINGAMAFFK